MAEVDQEYENLPTFETQDLDYQRRVERLEFTHGLSREELMRKINTPESSGTSE
jgi:hypothetical protein